MGFFIGLRVRSSVDHLIFLCRRTWEGGEKGVRAYDGFAEGTEFFRPGDFCLILNQDWDYGVQAFRRGFEKCFFYIVD